MAILSRYILRELFYYLLVLVVVFLAFSVVKEIVDLRDEILGAKAAGATDAALFVLYSMPGQLLEALPLLSLFAALFAIGLMARHREVLAMAAAGASFLRLSTAVALYGCVIAVSAFVMAEYVAPLTMKRADYVYKVRISGKNALLFNSAQGIFLPLGERQVYSIAAYDTVRKVMVGPTILIKSERGDGLSRRIEAGASQFLGVDARGRRLWEFTDARVWEFDGEQNLIAATAHPKLTLELEDKLDRFLSAERHPEEMRLGELRDYRDFLLRERAEGPLSIYLYTLHAKFAAPIACFFLALTAWGISVDLRTRRFVLVFTTGLIIGIVYYGLLELLKGMARGRTIDPIVAAWLPVALLTAGVAALARRLAIVR
jgi:lipopolysaccharide export system permease protein